MTLSSAAAETPASEVEKTWYRVDIAGAPAGWLSESESHTSELSTFASQLEIAIRRGQDEQTLQFESGFSETAEGDPVEAWAVQRLGQLATLESRFEFLDDRVEIRTRSGDDPFAMTSIDRPAADWMTPSKVQRELERRLIGASEPFSIRTIDPLLGIQPVETLWQPTAEQTSIEIMGVEHLCRRWHQTQEAVAPGVVTEVDIDASGTIIRSRTEFLGMTLTMTRWPEKPSISSEQLPESLRQSFIHPDRAIDRPRQLVRATYSIDLDPRAAAIVPSSGPQTTETTASGLRVTVDLDHTPKVAVPTDLESLLRPSLYLDFENPSIERLRQGIFEDSRDARPLESSLERALLLRAFVHQHLRDKDLTAILATASEVAETRTGDCTEHSILLAALLRAEGIPSRVVTGVVYIDSFVGERDIFGYHMWTQAWIENRWHDLDASFSTVFDATHIALGYATLNDESPALLELAHLADLSNGAQLRVIETHYR